MNTKPQFTLIDYDSGGFMNSLDLNGPLVQFGFNF